MDVREIAHSQTDMDVSANAVRQTRLYLTRMVRTMQLIVPIIKTSMEMRLIMNITEPNVENSASPLRLLIMMLMNKRVLIRQMMNLQVIQERFLN